MNTTAYDIEVLNKLISQQTELYSRYQSETNVTKLITLKQSIQNIDQLIANASTILGQNKPATENEESNKETTVGGWYVTENPGKTTLTLKLGLYELLEVNSYWIAFKTTITQAEQTWIFSRCMEARSHEFDGWHYVSMKSVTGGVIKEYYVNTYSNNYWISVRVIISDNPSVLLVTIHHKGDY